MNLTLIINRRTIPAAFAACGVMFVLLAAGVCAAAASSGQASPDSKTTCTDSSSKTVSGKACEKADAKGKSAAVSKSAPGTAKSGNKESAANSAEKDKLSGEHMSTRGLKPPPKNTDKDKPAQPDNAPKQ